jgi:type IV pilus assembly protein PilB
MKTIGSILLDVELVIQEDIDRALEIQKQTGQRLGEILVNLGVVSDDDIRWALAEQLNLPYVNIRKDQIDIEVATLIPEKLARRYHVIPILRIGDELTIVVDDPLNQTIIKDIETITKLHVKISLGRTSDIMMAIDEIYGRAEEDVLSMQEIPPRFLSSWFVEDDIPKILNDPSGSALLDCVLANAYTHGVSQIYFQPGFHTHYISYRVNGVIQKQVELSKEWYAIALFRLKISAGFEISNVLFHQYREFSYWEHIVDKEPGREALVRIAVSILPTTAGEAATVYIIDKPLENMTDVEHQAVIPSFQQKELLEIGNIKTTLQHLKSGIIFLTGSPYPDKITTLYSLLQGLDHVRKKIVTLEAYTEYRTDKFYQMRYTSGSPGDIFEKNLLTSLEHPQDPIASPHQASALDNLNPETQTNMAMSGDLMHSRSRSSASTLLPESRISNPTQKVLSFWLSGLKKYDADVLLVDHIESDVVLSQCLDYAASQLMLGSFSFKNVFELLAYCLDCQIPPSVLVSRVYALLAQQSVFLLCQECKQRDATDFAKQIVARLSAASVEGHSAPVLSEAEGEPEIFAPGGCATCHGTGYTQPIVLFEVLKMESWLKEMLMTHIPLFEIRSTAVGKGFSSIKQKSIELLRTGKTSLEQVFSIIIS